MRPFQYLDQPSLLDVLAYVTKKYTRMYRHDTMSHNDYMACRELIRLIQLEIESRKLDNQDSNTGLKPGDTNKYLDC